MSRTTTLTIAFLLLFLGVKLRLVQSYHLTPAATQFWIERIEDPEIVARNNLQQFVPNNRFNSNFQQASYPTFGVNQNLAMPQKVVTPPQWVCWPVFFLGAFMLLNGMSMSKD